MFLAVSTRIGRSKEFLDLKKSFKTLSRFLATMQDECCEHFSLATNP